MVIVQIEIIIAIGCIHTCVNVQIYIISYFKPCYSGTILIYHVTLVEDSSAAYATA